jgi:hypothetical protein
VGARVGEKDQSVGVGAGVEVAVEVEVGVEVAVAVGVGVVGWWEVPGSVRSLVSEDE